MNCNVWYAIKSNQINNNDKDDGNNNSLGSWDTNGSSNLGQKTRRRDYWKKIKNKKTICRIADFAVPADPIVKSKENDQRDNYVVTELKKKSWNNKRTVILTVPASLETIPKSMIRGLEE